MNAIVTLCPGLGKNNPHMNHPQMKKKEFSMEHVQWSTTMSRYCMLACLDADCFIILQHYAAGDKLMTHEHTKKAVVNLECVQNDVL